MQEKLQYDYAQEILEGRLDPFAIDFQTYEKEHKKKEFIGFEEVSEDIDIVKRYLVSEDEEFILEDLIGAWRSQDYLDVAEAMLFDDLDKEMAKIVVNKALQLAQTSEDYVNIAELFIEEFNDKEKAREAYIKGVEVAIETTDLTFVADSVADNDYLADKEFAREIYQEALTLAKNMYDFVFVARSLATPEFLNDKEAALEVLEVAKGVVNEEDFDQLTRLAISFALYTNDSKTAKEYIIKALGLCESFEQYYKILEHLAMGEFPVEFFKKVMKITLLAMEQQNQKEKVASLVASYLGDEKLAAFLRRSSAEEIIQFYSHKDLEDLKFAYAQKILNEEINPKELRFEDFIKQQGEGS
jgi:hypothetical protein